MTRGIIERRIAALEQRNSLGDRRVTLIQDADHAGCDRQIAELVAAGEVSPRDGFITLTGRAPS